MVEQKERLHYEVQGQCLIVYVTEDLDHHLAKELRERSDRLIQSGGIRHIIFDFEGVRFMDSSGIGLLMGRYKKVLFIGGKAAVTHVGREIDRIFKMSGLYQIIERYETPQEAVAQL
ncbi:MAG: anti-sigma factor antagonist [Lachnospiraceae bacterium]|nr:anti-sigma factor antagonist [Lachnospiraceae bacterium]